MATKTISIDLEAYARLKGLRRGEESFSEILKRVLPRRVDLDQLFAGLESRQASRAFHKAVEQQIAGRRRPSRRPR